MSGSIRGQPPRSPTSSPSSASASASRIHGGDSNSNSGEAPLSVTGGSTARRSEPQALADQKKEYNTADHVEETVQRRRAARSSGGFLLDSAGFKRRDNRNKRVSASESGVDGSRASGKRRADEGNGPALRVRANGRFPGHLSRRSIGSSPLATEVTHQVSRRDEQTLSGSTVVATVDGPGEEHATQIGSGGTTTQQLESQALSGQAPPQPSTFDTNPAQIVSLALSLGESRRRQFSINRLTPSDPLGGRRIASSDQNSPRYVTSPILGGAGGSLKQHLQQQRRSSRNISPRSPAFDSSHSPRSSREQSQAAPTLAPPFTYDLINEFNINPSNATLARADKAKITLELLYEYRRLLQYLPKFPVSSPSRPSTAKGKGKRFPEEQDPLGRLYNPLQYIRNRKVRVRERKTFDAEADGWKDLTRVQNWVASVAGERADNVSRVDDKYPLPPFVAAQPVAPIDSPSPTSSIRNSRALAASKHIRQGGGWNTTPWDLLADAYWLDQDDNKRLIEDREGNKIYPVKRPVNESLSRLTRDSAPSSTRRSDSLTRPSQSPEKMASPAPETPDSLPEKRGRARHKFRDSITSLQNYGSSPDRKNLWKLNIRSRSPSSSSESTTDSLHRPGRMGALKIRERQDSALLEKQFRDRLAKETKNTRDSPEGGQNSGFVSEADGVHHSFSNGKATRNAKKIGKQRGRPAGDRADELTSSSPVVTVEEPEEERGRRPRTSFEEFDSTAPSSPISPEFAPSIAINLTPPQKQPSSLRPLARPSRSRDGAGRKNHSINATDFADATHLSRNNTLEADDEDNFVDALPQLETPGFLSPKAAENVGKKLHHRRSDSNSLRKPKDSDSRLKDLFKGNRFTEAVGDIFRRRDLHPHDDYVPSPASSVASDVSEAEENPSSPKPRKRHRWSKNKNEMEDNQALSRQNTSDAAPVKYHRSDLPTFRSPFRSGEDTSVLTDDHITTQQKARRELGRSSRFGRLAPPTLNMRGISPSPSSSLSRVTTYETNEDSRRSSADRHPLGGFQFPNQLKSTRGMDPISSPRGPPPTGLSGLDSRRRPSPPDDRQRLNSNLSLAIPSRSFLQTGKTVTPRDIAQIRATIVHNGVFASGVLRRMHEIRTPPPQLLLDLQGKYPRTPLPIVSRMQEQVAASRILRDYIEDAKEAIQSAIYNFADVTDPDLHETINQVGEHISEELTPAVRCLATEADVLLNDLNTTHRLEIKALGDTIDAILRAKRQRFRSLRRSVWVVVEVVINVVLFLFWVCMLLFRITRGFVKGTYRVARWLVVFWE